MCLHLIPNAVKKLMFAVLLAMAFASCETPSESIRKSVMPPAIIAEKVLILTVEPFVATLDGQAITYKVKRLEKGVVQFVRLYNQQSVYCVGDTIYARF